MKNSIFKMLILLVLISCGSRKKLTNSLKEHTLFEVYKIDSINNYYLVYAKKNDSIFKIVAKKDMATNCKMIEVKHKYEFQLKSDISNPPIINGVKMTAPNIDCYVFDTQTSICLERNNGIYDLYFADNLKGLCIISKD